MAEEQDIKQETVDETANATNVEEIAVEEAEEVVADASHVLDELKADFDNRYKRLQADFENFKRRTNQEKEQLAGYVKGIEAPVNGGRNNNGPKVAKFLVG